MSWRTQRIRLAAASGVVAELLSHPAGAAASAEAPQGDRDRRGDHAGIRGI